MKKILIVDDQQEVRELLEVTLQIGEYTILHAGTGPEALEIASAEHPDLIFLDIMMPEGGMDGYDVCRKLKSDSLTSDIKIVMLTAKGQKSDRVRGVEAGADDYFTKPFSPLALMTKVDTILGD